MILESIDWVCIFTFFTISLVIGVIVSKRAGRSSSEFFLSGRNMPWWLLGVSMVATTFSTDTPNLVTDIVRQNGVAGNWVWWAFLLTGMLTVFVYAKLWRRSGVMTDIEFYELRYSGKVAAFLRGFRALYLGVFFNVVIMASVTLAAIKIGGVMLGLSPFQTVAIAAVVTVTYSMLGGLRGVLITDFIQFAVAMFGAIMAAKISLQHTEVAGLANLIA
ncbi:MAG: sodium:solute symporter family transporter, partial [Planctomycetota bacterium]